MSSKDDQNNPPPVRQPRLRELAPGIVRPPMRTADDEDDEEVEDEVTWAAAGSPYIQRQDTAEFFYDEDKEATTGIDWNAPTGTGHTATESDTLNFDVRPSTHTDAGHTTDYPTEPGFGTDGNLTALRDAMRTGQLPLGRRRQAHNPPPLPIPQPRARTSPGTDIPVAPRMAPPQRVSAPSRLNLPGQANARPSRRSSNDRSLVAILAPVVVGAIVIMFVLMLALRLVDGGPAPVTGPPMLPVVGGPPPTQLPPPPFSIDPPAPFRQDLLAGKQATIEEMPVKVVEAQAVGEPALAAAWSDRLVRTSNRPAMFFKHAELLAAAGDVDAALYWMVRATQEHGVPPEWFVEHDGFSTLWGDTRWNPIITWVIQANRYFAGRGAIPATIVLPNDTQAAMKQDSERMERRIRGSRLKPSDHPLPVVVWLADIAGNGASVQEWGQQLADELGAVIVGIGGPARIGPAGSKWTSDADRDLAHVQNALSAMPNEVAVDPKRRLLVGVGQGAQYAIELVLRDPDWAHAALAIAPTDDWKGLRDKAGEGQRDREQSVRLVAGALDPDAHTLLRLDRGRLMRAGVDVDIQIDETPWPDGIPPDLNDRIVSWARHVIDPNAEPAETEKPEDLAQAPEEPE